METHDTPDSTPPTPPTSSTPPASEPTTPPATTATASPATAEALSRTERELNDAVDSAKKKRNIMGIATALLAIAAVIYLSWAYSQIAQVDARTAVQLVEVQVDPYLNRPAQEWAAQLQAQAPDVMARAEAAALEMPERASERAIEFVTDGLDAKMPEIKSEIMTMVDDFAKGTKELAQERYGTTELNEEQMQSLMTDVSKEFERSLGEKMDELQQKYREVADELIAYLDELATSNDLTETQKIHREIIVSFLALAESWNNQAPELGAEL